MYGWEKWKNEHNLHLSSGNSRLAVQLGWPQYETEFVESFAFVHQLTNAP